MKYDGLRLLQRQMFGSNSKPDDRLPDNVAALLAMHTRKLGRRLGVAATAAGIGLNVKIEMQRILVILQELVTDWPPAINDFGNYGEERNGTRVRRANRAYDIGARHSKSATRSRTGRAVRGPVSKGKAAQGRAGSKATRQRGVRRSG